MHTTRMLDLLSQAVPS